MTLVLRQIVFARFSEADAAVGGASVCPVGVQWLWAAEPSVEDAEPADSVTPRTAARRWQQAAEWGTSGCPPGTFDPCGAVVLGSFWP